MSAATIIESLGGKRAVAALTGAKPNAVTQWRRIGIPGRFWHILVRDAAEKGVAGITFDALAATKPTAQAEAA